MSVCVVLGGGEVTPPGRARGGSTERAALAEGRAKRGSASSFEGGRANKADGRGRTNNLAFSQQRGTGNRRSKSSNKGESRRKSAADDADRRADRNVSLTASSPLERMKARAKQRSMQAKQQHQKRSVLGGVVFRAPRSQSSSGKKRAQDMDLLTAMLLGEASVPTQRQFWENPMAGDDSSQGRGGGSSVRSGRPWRHKRSSDEGRHHRRSSGEAAAAAASTQRRGGESRKAPPMRDEVDAALGFLLGEGMERKRASALASSSSSSSPSSSSSSSSFGGGASSSSLGSRVTQILGRSTKRSTGAMTEERTSPFAEEAAKDATAAKMLNAAPPLGAKALATTPQLVEEKAAADAEAASFVATKMMTMTPAAETFKAVVEGGASMEEKGEDEEEDSKWKTRRRRHGVERAFGGALLKKKGRATREERVKRAERALAPKDDRMRREVGGVVAGIRPSLLSLLLQGSSYKVRPSVRVSRWFFSAVLTKRFDQLIRNRRRLIRAFLDEPRSSRLATAYMVLSGALITLNVISLVFPSSSISCAVNEGWQDVADHVAAAVFTVELGLRTSAATEWVDLALDPYYHFDFLSVLPAFVEVAVAAVAAATVEPPRCSRGLRLLKALRMLRLLKIARANEGFVVIARAIRLALPALTVALFFLTVTVFIFAALLYFIERTAVPDNPTFYSIPHAMWVMVVVMTTVGYGEVFPVSVSAKCVTAVAMLFGVLFVAMPMAVVGNNFCMAWDDKERLFFLRKLQDALWLRDLTTADLLIATAGLVEGETLSFQDFADILKILKIRVPNGRLAILWRTLDNDKSGDVSLAEFEWLVTSGEPHAGTATNHASARKLMPTQPSLKSNTFVQGASSEADDTALVDAPDDDQPGEWDDDEDDDDDDENEDDDECDEDGSFDDDDDDEEEDRYYTIAEECAMLREILDSIGEIREATKQLKHKHHDLEFALERELLSATALDPFQQRKRPEDDAPVSSSSSSAPSSVGAPRKPSDDDVVTRLDHSDDGTRIDDSTEEITEKALEVETLL